LTVTLVDQSEPLVFQDLNVLVKVGEALTWILSVKTEESRGGCREVVSQASCGIQHGYLQGID
jgi:hypothetical protein